MVLITDLSKEDYLFLWEDWRMRARMVSRLERLPRTAYRGSSESIGQRRYIGANCEQCYGCLSLACDI